MKKFKFSLDTVLTYKQQVLDSLQGEYALAMAEVRAQEAVLAELWDCYRKYGAEFREKSAVGMSTTEMLFYENGFRGQEHQIQLATDKLKLLQEEAERRRENMVEARKETASLENLREHKLSDYNKAVQKSEEAFIEEFVMQTHLGAAVRR